MTTQVQMNARIDSELKKRGDEALLRAGYSPSRAIRALWGFAAMHANEPHAISSVLDCDSARPSRSNEDNQAVFNEGLALKHHFEKKLGFTLAFDDGLSDKDHLEEALYERYTETK